MSYVPREPSGNDAESHFMKWVWRVCRRVFADSPTVKWDLTDEKTIIAHALPPNAALRANLRFAKPIDYDPATQYKYGEIVIVRPDNTAVTAGVTDGVDGGGEDNNIATAGTWVCVKPPRVTTGEGEEAETAIHVPAWPLPNADPDHADNHWLLIGLHPYPTRGCDSAGEEVFSYVQRTPWQTEEITLLDD